jgi:hypothetical protein
MNFVNGMRTRVISTILPILLCAAQQAAFAAPQQGGAAPPAADSTSASPSSAPTQTAQDQPAQSPAQNQSTQSPPAQTPAAKPSIQELPDSPGAAQNNPNRPVGTAAAEIGNASGTPASKPAGVAIAPAKQKQSRSLLIKLGAIAGVAVALGTVFALSNSTSSKPPNAP